MSAIVRIPTSDDIRSNADLIAYLRAHQQILNRLGYEYAVAGPVVRSLLKDADRKAGQRRRHKTARPFSFAAGSMILGSKQLALVATRFNVLYVAEIDSVRRRTTRRRQPGMVFS